MPTLYKVEVFTREMSFRSVGIVDHPEIAFDYLTLERTEIVATGITVEKGDFLHITDAAGAVVCQGIVSDVTLDKKIVSVEADPLHSLLDISVTYDRNDLQTGALEDFIANVITRTYITNPDGLQNIPGLSVAVTSHTANTALNIKSNVHDLWDIISKALTMYDISVEAVFFPQSKEIRFIVGRIADTRTFESDLPNCIEKEFVIGDSYGAKNKITFINKHNETERVTYYLHSNGSVDTNDTDRVTPVFFLHEYIEANETDPAAFWEEALKRAKEKLTPQQYNNEICLKYRTDDLIVSPNSIRVGTKASIHKGNRVYASVLTGYEKTQSTVTLIFGVVRTALTKKLILERRFMDG